MMRRVLVLGAILFGHHAAFAAPALSPGEALSSFLPEEKAELSQFYAPSFCPYAPQAFAGVSDDLPNLAPKAKAGMTPFSALHGYRSVWNLSEDEARNLIDSVDISIVYHGLDSGAYRLEEMRQLVGSKTELDRQRLDFLVTASLLRLAHDLHGDNVNLRRLYPGWDFHRRETDIPAALNAAVADGTLGAFFQSIAPQHQAYRSLAVALQLYRLIEGNGGWPAIARGDTLRPKERGERVSQVRARLAAEGYLTSSAEGGEDFFDEELSRALVAYQTHNGLLPDGQVGAKTQEALNVPVAARIVQIRANMERWRHMPEDFPSSRYVMVNIPDFTVTVFDNGAEIYKSDIIGGRVDRPTPFVKSDIYNMVINPSWHVPPSIARKDILPKLRKDPFYLEKIGAVIKGRDEDPSGTTIDWGEVSSSNFKYAFRQRPSERNSLGPLKFNFQNPFDVYMHGTPHQELFKKAERSFSSGCVRLEDPVGIGEILLKNNKDEEAWDKQRILDKIGTGETRYVNLAEPMPVYFLYWSVFLDASGQVNFRKDIYSYDARLMNAIKNSSFISASK